MYSKNVSKTVKKKNRNRILTQNSDFSQRTDGGNIFLDSSQQYIDSRSIKNIVKESKRKQEEQFNQSQVQNENNKIQKKEWISEQNGGNLSFFESFRYYSGQHTKTLRYPYSKLIAINNSNNEENRQNRKILKEKYGRFNNQLGHSQQYYSFNSLKVSFIIPVLFSLYDFLTSCWEWYLYLTLTIINSVVQKHIFLNNAQYVGQPIILIIFTIFYLVTHVFSQYLTLRKRNSLKENSSLYQVYTHDGIQQQWKLFKATQIKPGYIYKVKSAQIIPTDSLLLHAKKSMVLIDQTEHIQNGKSSRILKDIAIKSQKMKLPISGILEYKVQAEQNDCLQWIKGRLDLQEPQKIAYQVQYKNILKNNSFNVSQNQSQLICLALQCGVDSFNFKAVGYPSLWKNHQKIISNQTQMSIKKMSFYFLIATFVCYFILCAVGILVGYLSKSYIKNHFYLGQSINALEILFYHSTNFIIFIPIFLTPSLLIYQILMTKIAQTNIKNRKFQAFKSKDQEKITQQKLNNASLDQKEHDIFLMPRNKVTFKDNQMISYLHYPHILVTETQLFKQNQSQHLKLIYLKDFQYIFPSNHSVVKQKYTNEEINLIKSFLSVSLLTFNIKSSQKQNNFFQSLKQSAKQEFQLLIHRSKQFFTVTGPLQQVFSESKLQLIPFFTINASKQYPYSIYFYQIPQQKNKQDEEARVLCILRGDPETILMKVYNKKTKMLMQSEKIHQENGFQVQFVGKFSCFYHEAQHIKELYEKSTTERQRFYGQLESYLVKTEPMGLLAFQNEFSGHYKDKQINKFMDMNTKMNKSDICGFQGYFPNTILINPRPKYSLHPEQESIESIKFILTNQYLFNFNQDQVRQKILYDPIPVDEMVEKLRKQKVIVFNGWSQQNLKLMLTQLRRKHLLMAVIEKQDQTYLTKLCQYSTVIGSKNLAHNYADILIEKEQNSSNKMMALLSLIQILNFDSHLAYQGQRFIMLAHVIKFMCYFVIECINMAFTLGTGITLIRLPLYLLTQVIVFLDVFYHLNWSDRKEIINKQKGVSNCWYYCIKSVSYCLIGGLILVYSSVKPDDESSAVFCVLQVHFLVTHLLIFSMIFFRKSIDLYGLIIIAIQIVIYYVGMVIISKVSLYEFNGMLSYMFHHKLFLVSIICLWMFFSFDYIVLAIRQSLSKIKEEMPIHNYQQVTHKQQQVKRLHKETNLSVIDLQTF